MDFLLVGLLFFGVSLYAYYALAFTPAAKELWRGGLKACRAYLAANRRTSPRQALTFATVVGGVMMSLAVIVELFK